MKIRQGFVSNSSSSSFIVVWDKKPESAEEVKKILYGNRDTVGIYDYTMSAQDLATVVFNDTKEATDEEIIEKLSDSFGYSGEWFGDGYKPDQKLMEKREEEYNSASSQYVYYDNILNSMKKGENIIIERDKKLSRILGEKETNKQTEKEIKKRMYDLNSIMWNNDTEKEIAMKSCYQLRKDFEGKFISTYEYSDNGGNIGIILEHGDTFHNLFHITINQH